MPVQILKSFRGLNTAATFARIDRRASEHADGDFYRVVTVDEARRQVVDVAEFSTSWGVWTVRELLMSWDAKASGRTTHAYDHSGGPDLLPLATRIFDRLRAVGAFGPSTTRALWALAYHEARRRSIGGTA